MPTVASARLPAACPPVRPRLADELDEPPPRTVVSRSLTFNGSVYLRIKRREVPSGRGRSHSSSINFVILVTEPTPSGLHDLERAADLCARFPRPAGVIINKEGLNPAREREIADLCTARGLPLLGRIPYDKIVVDALMSGLTMADLGEHRASKAIRTAWNNVIALAVESRSVESIHS